MTAVRPDGATRPSAPSVADAEAAVTLAQRAPSIHNTQPWRWELRSEGLLLLADRARQLQVADPDGHSLLLSCGAALHLTELALRSAGWRVQVERWPEPGDPDLLARFRVGPRQDTDPDDVERAEAARRRRSDRRPFRPEPVPEDVREALRDAGTRPGVDVDFPVREDQRFDFAVALSWADRVEREDPAYQAEMQHWLREAAQADGVPMTAVPRVDAQHPRRTDVPLRDFEVGLTGRQLIDQDVDEKPLLAVLFAREDSAAEQLAAGEAMMALMVEAETRDLASCPVSQAVDHAAFRTRLQGVMGWVGLPQMILRLGHPRRGADDLPHAPRRAVTDVLRVVEAG